MSKFSLWLTYSTCKKAKRKPQQQKLMCVNCTTPVSEPPKSWAGETGRCDITVIWVGYAVKQLLPIWRCLEAICWWGGSVLNDEIVSGFTVIRLSLLSTCSPSRKIYFFTSLSSTLSFIHSMISFHSLLPFLFLLHHHLRQPHVHSTTRPYHSPNSHHLR